MLEKKNSHLIRFLSKVKNNEECFPSKIGDDEEKNLLEKGENNLVKRKVDRE